MKASAFLIGLLLTTFAWTDANANVISMNLISGSNPSADNPYVTGKSDDPNITASGIGHRSGITGTSGAGRYNAKSWTTNRTVDVDDYFYFILDANDGYKINFTSFEYSGTRSTSGPTLFAFRSSLDGFTTNIGSPAADGATINLSSVQFQKLTDPIEFRLYGYSASSGSGTFSINDYQFKGTATATANPEPQTMALFGIGALLMLWNQRRMRDQAATEA
jgi:hypothetical protein